MFGGEAVFAVAGKWHQLPPLDQTVQGLDAFQPQVLDCLFRRQVRRGDLAPPEELVRRRLGNAKRAVKTRLRLQPLADPGIQVTTGDLEELAELLAGPDLGADTLCLRGWDKGIDKLDPKPGYKEERRAAIADAFERLLRVCRYWESL